MPKMIITMGQAFEMSKAFGALLRNTNMPVELAWEACQNSAVIDRVMELLRKRETEIFEQFAERGADGKIQVERNGLPALRKLRKADGELDVDENGTPQDDMAAFVARQQTVQHLHNCRIRVNLEVIPRSLLPETIDPNVLKGLLPMIDGFKAEEDDVEFLDVPVVADDYRAAESAQARRSGQKKAQTAP